MPRSTCYSKNLSAFLDTITLSELGQSIIDGSDDGYDVVVGSTPQLIDIFSPYDRHPHKTIHLVDRNGQPIYDANGKPEISSAAGAGQILGDYADHYINQLGLPDFGPESQDAIKVQMIKECRALAMIEAGAIQSALVACASRWASLPKSPYGQHTQNLSTLLVAYQAAGGTVVAA